MCYMYFPIQLHVMSNQLNLPQVDSDQVVETFDRWTVETMYVLCFCSLILLNLQDFEAISLTLSLWGIVCRILRWKIKFRIKIQF